MLWTKSITYLLTGALLLLAGCGGSRQNDPIQPTQATLDGILEKTLQYTILPAVDGFASQADNFNQTAGFFCANLSTANLQELQDGWKQLNKSWYRLAPYNFGPLNDDVVFPAYIYIDSLRLRGTDYTATVQQQLSKDIAASYPLDSTYFDSLNFQKVGLLPLELLSFKTIDGTLNVAGDIAPDDIVAEYRLKPRKCELLTGLSQQLNNRAAYVQNGWRNNYKNTNKPYTDLFLSAELEDGTEPITRLLTSVQAYLDYLKKRHVADVAAEASGYIWPLLAETINEVERLLQGSPSNSLNIFSLMRVNGYDSEVQAVQENIQFARAGIELKNTTDFEAAAALLDGNFKREIPNSLDVQLGINFTDGD